MLSNFFEDLVKLYDVNHSKNGFEDMVLGHFIKMPEYIININTVDMELSTCTKYPNKQPKLLCPYYGSSIARTSGCAPHALFDNVSYISKSLNPDRYNAYIKQLSQYHDLNNFFDSVYNFVTKYDVINFIDVPAEKIKESSFIVFTVDGCSYNSDQINSWVSYYDNCENGAFIEDQNQKFLRSFSLVSKPSDTKLLTNGHLHNENDIKFKFNNKNNWNKAYAAINKLEMLGQIYSYKNKNGYLVSFMVYNHNLDDSGFYDDLMGFIPSNNGNSGTTQSIQFNKAIKSGVIYNGNYTISIIKQTSKGRGALLMHKTVTKKETQQLIADYKNKLYYIDNQGETKSIGPNQIISIYMQNPVYKNKSSALYAMLYQTQLELLLFNKPLPIYIDNDILNVFIKTEAPSKQFNTFNVAESITRYRNGGNIMNDTTSYKLGRLLRILHNAEYTYYSKKGGCNRTTNAERALPNIKNNPLKKIEDVYYKVNKLNPGALSSNNEFTNLLAEVSNEKNVKIDISFIVGYQNKTNNQTTQGE